MKRSTVLAGSRAHGHCKSGVRRLTLSLVGIVLATGAAHAVNKAHDPSAGSSLVPSLAARIAAMPKYLPRATAPGLPQSIAAAEAAQKACAAKGVKVSVLVTDSVGEPVVLLSGDGAGVRSQLIARTKAAIAIKYKMPSSEVALRAQTDPRLNAEAAADPDIGVLRGGGLPLIRGGKMIGAVAVSGGSLGPTHDHTLDEKCARVAMERLEAH
ncbi:MAG: GlcG/HbpS family heme-binding protein [Acetobacteraceae bacterium]